VETVAALVVAHSTLVHELSAQLIADHGVSMSEYEALLLLSRADERRMTRTDLAQQVRLSPSGITRMLNRLEGAGLVEKGSCATDARITYAVLTDAGVEKLKECAPDHMAAIDRQLGDRLSKQEIATLRDLLGRLFEDDLDCSPGE